MVAVSETTARLLFEPRTPNRRAFLFPKHKQTMNQVMNQPTGRAANAPEHPIIEAVRRAVLMNDSTTEIEYLSDMVNNVRWLGDVLKRVSGESVRRLMEIRDCWLSTDNGGKKAGDSRLLLDVIENHIHLLEIDSVLMDAERIDDRHSEVVRERNGLNQQPRR